MFEELWVLWHISAPSTATHGELCRMLSGSLSMLLPDACAEWTLPVRSYHRLPVHLDSLSYLDGEPSVAKESRRWKKGVPQVSRLPLLSHCLIACIQAGDRAVLVRSSLASLLWDQYGSA